MFAIKPAHKAANSSTQALVQKSIRRSRIESSLHMIPLLVLAGFATPLLFSISEISGSATTNQTTASHCDVNPLTITLLKALSQSNSAMKAPIESCSFIHDAARAGKVTGVFFHTDLTAGGFDFVPPAYQEALTLRLKDSDRLTFESEKESFQSLKAAWIEELTQQTSAPTAVQARNLWLKKYQPMLSDGSQKTVQKIAKSWINSAQFAQRTQQNMAQRTNRL